MMMKCEMTEACVGWYRREFVCRRDKGRGLSVPERVGGDEDLLVHARTPSAYGVRLLLLIISLPVVEDGIRCGMLKLINIVFAWKSR